MELFFFFEKIIFYRVNLVRPDPLTKTHVTDRASMGSVHRDTPVRLTRCFSCSYFSGIIMLGEFHIRLGEMCHLPRERQLCLDRCWKWGQGSYSEGQWRGEVFSPELSSEVRTVGVIWTSLRHEIMRTG